MHLFLYITYLLTNILRASQPGDLVQNSGGNEMIHLFFISLFWTLWRIYTLMPRKPEAANERKNICRHEDFDTIATIQILPKPKFDVSFVRLTKFLVRVFILLFLFFRWNKYVNHNFLFVGGR